MVLIEVNRAFTVVTETNSKKGKGSQEMVKNNQSRQNRKEGWKA